MKGGRSDDGKRNILWEWPNWYPSQVFQGWRYVIKLLCPGNYASSDPCSLRKFAYIASRSIRPDGRTVIQLAKHKRINYCSKYVFPKYMFNSTYLPWGRHTRWYCFSYVVAEWKFTIKCYIQVLNRIRTGKSSLPRRVRRKSWSFDNMCRFPATINLVRFPDHADSIIEMDNFYYGVATCSDRKVYSESLKFLSIFLHISGFNEPTTLVPLERSFPPTEAEYI